MKIPSVTEISKSNALRRSMKAIPSNVQETILRIVVQNSLFTVIKLEILS